MGSQVDTRDESYLEGNIPYLQQKTETYFDAGKIYFMHNKLEVKATPDAPNSGIALDYLYVLDKKGKLYLGSSEILKTSVINHSFFLKSKIDKPTFGYGKELACAGHIEIKDGKIVKINNSSGHYQPSADQLNLAAHYLFGKGALTIDTQISNYTNTFTHDNIMDIDIDKILSQHQEIPNFDESLNIFRKQNLVQVDSLGENIITTGII